MATVFFTPKTQYFDQASAGAEQATTSLAQQTSAFEQFTLVPMTAGDIIDRAVRLYRQHFLVFLRIVLAPSLIA